MTNSRRFHLASVPQHVVQRGNNRQPCFLVQEDYCEYLTRLASASRRFGVAIHAYVLMTNHVHLLATPDSVDGVGRLMQAVGAGYVRSFNEKHRRTGTLWDGRYFSSLVGGNSYLWNCYRYIELNPVRAGIVSNPGRYPWSSFASNALGSVDPVITPHPEYVNLSRHSAEATAAYRAMVSEGLADATIAEIRERLLKERAFGDEAFLETIAAVARRSPHCRAPGRPRGVSTKSGETELTTSDLFS